MSEDSKARLAHDWSELESTKLSDIRVVAFGGGTGMSCLLRGLKAYTQHLTAIVTVTDDGGSSGRLRTEFDMVPPGDIRNCLVALADDSNSMLGKLLQYRFTESVLDGHSFGNLFLTALTRITGSFDAAVRELNTMLGVHGKVLPATGSKVALIATHPDGSKSTGEVKVSASDKPIEHVEMRPRVGPAAADIIEAIQRADVIVFGPGSLFTSVIPNLLVPGIADAVLENPCPKVYVTNIMTQPGETTGLTLSDHLEALEAHVGRPFITGLIVHRGDIPDDLEARYNRGGSKPVGGLGALSDARDLKVAYGELIDPTCKAIRHESGALARCIAENFFVDVLTTMRRG